MDASRRIRAAEEFSSRFFTGLDIRPMRRQPRFAHFPWSYERFATVEMPSNKICGQAKAGFRLFFRIRFRS